MAVSLPTHVGDPLRRVRLTALSTEIAKEKRITLLLGAANRDPARWDRRDQFDVGRK
jgi:cytochrome P450